MCRLVVAAMQNGNDQVIEDGRRVAGKADDPDWIPRTPQEFASAIFCTAYMGSKNSSSDTRRRAKDLAQAIGAYHVNIDIDAITTAIVNVFYSWSNWMPKFKSSGGSVAENLAVSPVEFHKAGAVTASGSDN